MPIAKLDENGKVIYGTSDPEFIGNLPIRQNIVVLPADEPSGPESWEDTIIITSSDDGPKEDKPFTLGWTVKETIGVGVINTRGLMRKSVIIG